MSMCMRGVWMKRRRGAPTGCFLRSPQPQELVGKSEARRCHSRTLRALLAGRSHRSAVRRRLMSFSLSE